MYWARNPGKQKIMGYPRPRPKRLAEKLLQIRRTLAMSQPKIAKHLGVKDYTSVSKWELNILEPPLAVLLAYARLRNVPVENLIDDELDLPLELSNEFRSPDSRSLVPTGPVR